MASVVKVFWLQGGDYDSLSDGEREEDEEEGTDSEDERRVLEQNRKNAEEAAAALEALKSKEKGNVRKRRSVVITNEIPAGSAPSQAQKSPPAVVSASTQPLKKRRADKADPIAAIEAMGRSIVSGLAGLQAYKIPKKSASPGEDEPWEEEDTIMLEEDWSIRDNSVDTLDLELRSKLRVPNGNCESWWTKSWISQKVCHPIRGSSLYLENLQGSSRPNDDVIMKFHDR